MNTILNEEKIKEMKTEDVLAKVCTYLYFADLAISNTTELTSNKILHIGLMIDNMNKEIKTLAPYYGVIDTFYNQDHTEVDEYIQ